jgi:hypothetical protein
MEAKNQAESTTTYSENEPQKLLNGSGKPKPTRPKKPKKVELYYQIYHVMNGRNFSMWPDFPHNFHVLKDDKGIKAVIEELPNQVCRYMSEDAVVDAIAKYCFQFLAHDPEAQLTNQEAQACFRLWRSLTPHFEEEIVPVAQKSENVLCWHRLDFDFEAGPTPVFDEMFSRASNGLALKCWIGSLLVAEADRQQYVWIYGKGNNGKGALARFLYKIMGPAYCSQQPPTEGDRFWTSGILGKRLVVFPDCADANWPKTGLFKSITGNDAVKIEEKGKQPFTTELCAKLLHLSNEHPNISSSAADLRRAIFCEFKPIEVKPMADTSYTKQLLAEGPAFMAQCLAHYREHCPDHEMVPVDIQGIEEIIEQNEERYWYMFMQNFTPVTDSAIEPTRLREWISPDRFQEIFKAEKIDFKKQRAFFEYIERTFGVKRHKVRLEGDKIVRRYLGARDKTQQEKETFKVEQGGEVSRF